MKDKQVRCAIYTRKSTEEGLDQDFNSLDAQREAGEAYIRSQKSEGWVCLPDRYDDGGFTGGNMDRPALQRLLEDIVEGKVDCIVVYKVDRLSRSLLDFARIMETLDKRKVSFASVTQQFNTTHSMGRLTLNILLSFAQFEREIIAERTRDKVHASRRKGKWTGGRPMLGYDVTPQGGRIFVNEAEAERVRAIFELYLEIRALMPTVQELRRRGWTNKLWVTKKHSHEAGGRNFTKDTLFRLLTNPIFMGKVRLKGEVYEGEHKAIISQEVWQKVQSLLRHNGRTGGREVRNKHGALLKDLLFCGSCNVKMMHTRTSVRAGNRRYRYYVCTRAQHEGYDVCATRSVPAAEMERVVIENIRRVGQDPGMLRETLVQTRRLSEQKLKRLRAERESLQKELGRCNAEVRALIEQTAPNGDGITPATARLADLQDRIRIAEQRSTEVREELLGVSGQMVNETELARALALFDPIWETLSPREQVRVVQLLVGRVVYNGETGKVAITFHPTGIKTLANDTEAKKGEVA